ncbi:MAG: DUF4293 domain-containing protein [Bacteroidales bacterium]|nr:DUF4293 domain-containing protein [Bacteroidales bacterium]
MIQRIQSVYLLLVTVLMSLLFFLPFAELTLQDGHLVVYHSYAMKKFITCEHSEMMIRTLPVVIMICAIGLISFVNIFLFNRRIIQMRICILTMLLLAGVLMMIFYYYYIAKSNFPVKDQILKFPVILPVIGIIFSLLAYRSINEDEMLVSSYDHLR